MVLFLLLDAQPVSACTPAPGATPPTLQQSFENASYVFTATVTDTNAIAWLMGNRLPPMLDISGVLGRHSTRFFGTSETRVRGYYALATVDAYYKGGGIAEVAIEGFGYGTDCLNPVFPGQRALFFTVGNPPFLRAYYHNYPYSAVVSITDGTLADLAAISGKPPTQPDMRQQPVWLPVLALTPLLVFTGVRAAARLLLR
ncbi:MAG: hypothetical protein SF123_07995 [Chloroflexota bacterium]|nr:hypothetical protein [Chloroflexota bacterium]